MCLLIVATEGFSSELMMEEQSEPSHFLPDIFYRSWKQALGQLVSERTRCVVQFVASLRAKKDLFEYENSHQTLSVFKQQINVCYLTGSNDFSSTSLQEKTRNLKRFLSVLLDTLSELEIKHCGSVCPYHLALPLHFAHLSLDEGCPNSCRDGGVS